MGAVNEKVIYRGAPSQNSLKTPGVHSRALHGAPDSEITREPERPVRVRYVFYHDHSGPGSERSPITRGRVGTVATVRHYLGIRGCLSICVIPEWFREDP